MTASDNSPPLLTQALPPDQQGAPAMNQAAGQQDPLAQLQDIHLPAEIGLWPPAIGWWLLVLTLLIVIVTSALVIRRRRQRNRYRTLALAELQQLDKFSQEHNGDWLQALSILLRRTAISGCGTQFDASLKGQDWLQWLDDRCPASKQQFSQGAGTALLAGPYQKQPTVDRPALKQLAHTWISEHRNQWQKPNAKPKTNANKIGAQHV